MANQTGDYITEIVGKAIVKRRYVAPEDMPAVVMPRPVYDAMQFMDMLGSSMLIELNDSENIFVRLVAKRLDVAFSTGKQIDMNSSWIQDSLEALLVTGFASFTAEDLARLNGE